MQKQPIFEARTHGYRTYRVPGIAIRPGGVVLATAEARRARAATGTSMRSYCAGAAMAEITGMISD